MVVFHQVHGLSSKWSFIRYMVWSGWSLTRWSLMRVVFCEGGFSSGWSLTRWSVMGVVFCEGGLSSGGFSSGWSLTRWSFIRVVFCKGGLTWGWSCSRVFTVGLVCRLVREDYSSSISGRQCTAETAGCAGRTKSRANGEWICCCCCFRLWAHSRVLILIKDPRYVWVFVLVVLEGHVLNLCMMTSSLRFTFLYEFWLIWTGFKVIGALEM